MCQRRRFGPDVVWTLLDTWLPTLFIAGVMLLIFVESVGRTVARASIIWYVEVLAVIFTWAVFLAGAAGIRSGRAIAVDAFYGMLGPRAQRAVLAFGNVVVVMTGLAWAWWLMQLTLDQGGLETVMLGIPFAVRTTGIILAFALIALYGVRALLRPAPPPPHSAAVEHHEE
ncbi:MAG: TRAP transporter small permease subunit [Actinobacteria bacterium]|nr:TRAP transporter small permease subunit [Actinomycetota bacterium]